MQQTFLQRFKFEEKPEYKQKGTVNFPDNELAKPEKCLQNIKRLKIGKKNQRNHWNFAQVVDATKQSKNIITHSKNTLS